MSEPIFICCPLCKGLGEMAKPDSVTEKHKAIIAMHDAKMSVRQIMRLLGYKSPRSVHVVIQNRNKFLHLPNR